MHTTNERDAFQRARDQLRSALPAEDNEQQLRRRALRPSYAVQLILFASGDITFQLCVSFQELRQGTAIFGAEILNVGLDICACSKRIAPMNSGAVSAEDA